MGIYHSFCRNRRLQSLSLAGMPLILMVICLFLIAGFGFSLYDDDLSDSNDLPVFTIPLVLSLLCGVSVMPGIDPEPAECAEALTGRRIPRSPPFSGFMA